MTAQALAHAWGTSPYEGVDLLIHLVLADGAAEGGAFATSGRINRSCARQARTTPENVETWLVSAQQSGVIEPTAAPVQLPDIDARWWRFTAPETAR